VCTSGAVLGFQSIGNRTVMASIDACFSSGGLRVGRLLKPSECCHIGKGVWPNRQITFIVAEKFNSVFLVLVTVYWGEGLVENSEYRHMEGGVEIA